MNNSELCNNYKNNGYVILKNFIDKEKLESLEQSIKAQILYHMNRHNLKIKDTFVDYGIIEMNKIRKDKKNFDSIQVIYNLVRKLPELYKIIGDEKLIEKIRLLSGMESDQSPYIWENFLRIDPPHDSTFDLNWHQESYFTLPNSNSVQLWSPVINQVSLKNTGTMCALKESSRLGEITHNIIKKNGYIHEGIFDDDIKDLKLEELHFELSPGDILLFNEHLVHKTIHNTGEKVRFTMVANYSNPYLSDFNFMNEKQVLLYHKQRTGNASKYPEYIDSFSSKGGIKQF